jgi:hypothetical protein
VKILLPLAAVLICAAIALFFYSSWQDQRNFSAASNDCERGCIQDSGGLDQCRAYCAKHPDHYP